MDRRAAVSCVTLACLVLAWPGAMLAQSAAEAAAPSATGVTTLRCGTLIDGRARDSPT